MKQQKVKRLVSVLLAFCLVFTCMLPALAASATYKATYAVQGKGTKQEYEDTLSDLSTILYRDGLSANTIMEMWKAVPGLASVLGESNKKTVDKVDKDGNKVYDSHGKVVKIGAKANTVEFYRSSNADYTVFKNFDKYARENHVTEVTSEVIAAYFEAYPLVFTRQSDFGNRFDAFIKTVITRDMRNLAFTGVSMIANSAFSNADDLIGFFAGFDELAKCLDIDYMADSSFKYNTPFKEIYEKNKSVGYDSILFTILSMPDDKDIHRDEIPEAKKPHNLLYKYISLIAKKFLPDVVSNTLTYAKNLAEDEQNAELYAALNPFAPRLRSFAASTGKLLPQLLEMLHVQLDANLSTVFNTIDEVTSGISYFPTVQAPNGATIYDYQGTVGYIVNEMVWPQIREKLPNEVRVSFPADFKMIRFQRDGWTNTNCLLRLENMNIENIRRAQDNTDMYNVVLHYLHKNLNSRNNRTLLVPVFKLIPYLAPEAEANEIVSFLDYMLSHSQAEVANKLYRQLHVMADQTVVFIARVTGFEPQSYKPGTEVTVTAPAAPDGQEFDKWVVVSGDQVKLADANAETTTFVMPISDVELKAQFKPKTYTVTVQGGETKDYQAGALVTVVAPKPPLGKVFKEWTVVSHNIALSNAKIGAATFVMPYEDVELKPNYQRFSIAFGPDGSDGSNASGGFLGGLLSSLFGSNGGQGNGNDGSGSVVGGNPGIPKTGLVEKVSLMLPVGLLCAIVGTALYTHKKNDDDEM